VRALAQILVEWYIERVMHQENDLDDIWEKEKEVLDDLKKTNPELFFIKDKNTANILRNIGIEKGNDFVCKGSLKTIAPDFIVEEIALDGTVSECFVPSQQVSTFPVPEGPFTTYATLIKDGLSTFDAIERLTIELGIPKESIGYGGLKDAVAFTAQRMSFRNVPPEKVAALRIPHVILKDIAVGKGVMNIGGIKGNRFSLVIRTQDVVDEALLAKKVASIESKGLINYYGPQRFGTPRYQSHIFGWYVLKKDYEKLFHAILVESSEFEWPLICTLREEAEKCYGDWEKMIDLFLYLPYTFKQEILLLKKMLSWDGMGDKYLFALREISEQLDFWVKSYASFLTNQYLSFNYKNNYALPEKIPLLLNTKESMTVQKLYGYYLKKYNTEDYLSVLYSSDFIRRGQNAVIQTRVFPTNLKYQCIPGAVVIGFDLPKGAYATTVLYELFDIEHSGEEGEGEDKYFFVDSRKLLGREGETMSLTEFVEKYKHP
jgi:TruD family tRNA pseudouridine synthase